MFPRMCTYLANACNASMLVSCTIVPAGIVSVKMDPFIMLLKDLGVRQAGGMASQLLRSLFAIHIFQVGTLSFRLLYLTSFMIAVHRIELLWALANNNLSKRLMDLYTETAIVERHMNGFELKATSAALSILFVGIVFCVNVIISAVERNNFVLVLAIPVVLLVFVVVLHLFFTIGCLFFDLSGLALHRWKKQVNSLRTKREVKFVSKLLNSLRVVSVPAGNVGIIDRDIKGNYWDKLLGTVADILITKNNLAYSKA